MPVFSLMGRLFSTITYERRDRVMARLAPELRPLVSRNESGGIDETSPRLFGESFLAQVRTRSATVCTFQDTRRPSAPPPPKRARSEGTLFYTPPPPKLCPKPALSRVATHGARGEGPHPILPEVGFKDLHPLLPGGKLAHRLAAWKIITRDPWVLQAVE